MFFVPLNLFFIYK